MMVLGALRGQIETFFGSEIMTIFLAVKLFIAICIVLLVVIIF